MKRRISRLVLLIAPALLVTMCLLALAGPALAGDQVLWRVHEFNSRTVSYGDGPDGSVAAQVVSSDPWAGGTLLFWWVGDSDGVWSLSNADGSWAGTWTGVLGKAQSTLTVTGTGSGDYAGYSIKIIGHTASGRSPLIMKGSYWE